MRIRISNSQDTLSRHCEEHLRRSNPASIRLRQRWIASLTLAMTLRQKCAFSRRVAPEVCMNSSPLNNRGRRECRARDAPAASHAVLETKHTSVVTTVTPETPGIPRAMVLRLPSCSPRRTKPDSHRRHRHWVSRTTRLLRPRQRARLAHCTSSIASRPAFRDDREPPLCGAGRLSI